MRIQSNGKVRRSEEEWEEILACFEKSGLSAVAFCRREKISKNTFSKWHGRMETKRSARSAAPFVELKPLATQPRSMIEAGVSTSGEFELSLPGGVVLRWRP
jgi:hypothetical protein